MNIVHICQTSVAGAAWSWSEAFKEAGYDSYCIARQKIRDLEFPSDCDWPPGPMSLVKLQEADLIFCHQGQPYRKEWYPKATPTVFCYHSPQSHVWRHGEKDGWPWCVIGQYQPRYYPGCAVVPNLIPLKHPWFQSGPKPTDRVRIAYSPSQTDRKGWDSKGYEQTLDILAELRQVVPEVPIEIDIITAVPLEDCLKRKATAHIVIDECVTGSYHRSSLEGLALGCVVINNCDAASANNLRALTGQDIPFVRSCLDTLLGTLNNLVHATPKKLAEEGQVNREWMERWMRPWAMTNRWFRSLMDEALAV